MGDLSLIQVLNFINVLNVITNLYFQSVSAPKTGPVGHKVRKV